MKLLKISNTKINACPLILGVVLFLSMTPIMHSEITNFKYVISDHLGTAKMLIDEEGNVIWPIIGTVESNELLPFGGELDVFQSEARYNLNFTNKELDRVLDLHYFGARYYQANIGRFLSPDPIGGNPEEPLSWNKYLYCRNNPIMFIDPTGMAMTAPKPDDSNGFEFVGPPEPPEEQNESSLMEQLEYQRTDAIEAQIDPDVAKNLNLLLTVTSFGNISFQNHHWWPRELGGAGNGATIPIQSSNPNMHTAKPESLHYKMHGYFTSKFQVNTWREAKTAFRRLDFDTQKNLLKEFYKEQTLNMPEMIKPGIPK